MELYNFLRESLAWTVTVAILWPANVPLAALAYKVRQGPRPIDMETLEFWLRSSMAAFALAVLTLVMVVIDVVLAHGADFPAGPVHLMVFMAYIPAAVWLLFVFFALEDLLQGLSVFMLYLYLPVIVLYVLNAIFGLWHWPLSTALSWLKSPA